MKDVNFVMPERFTLDVSYLTFTKEQEKNIEAFFKDAISFDDLEGDSGGRIIFIKTKGLKRIENET